MPAGRAVPDRAETLQHAVRVTLAASAGFYPLVYVFHQREMALYALFAPVALGVLSRVTGSGRQRAAVFLRALPMGIVLAALGTALAVSTAAAVIGMLVVGFVLAFAGVGGTRPAGVAPGLQLFYILACFPPYVPETLWQRIVGLTIGTLLLALCELFLMPSPAAASYRSRLADALSAASSAAAEAAGGRLDPAEADRLRTLGVALRPSRLPPVERPSGAGRSHRAFSQAGSATRRLLNQLADLVENPPGRPGAGIDPASAGLLRLVTEVCAGTAASLRSRNGARTGRSLEEAILAFQADRVRAAATPPGVPTSVLRAQSGVLAIAGSARIAQVAAAVGADGRRTPPIPPRELFWYADTSTFRLWARRLAGNATLRSVAFQNAIRIAAGLGAARLVAGSLDLAHGFWVLLAVLTLGRTTAGATWTAVRGALIGTLLGALAAGALLYAVGHDPRTYAVVLAPAMLAAFSLGPLCGVAWAQGLFTLVVSSAFAQLAPASWQIAEVRMLDVLTGSAIGLLCGLLAWPAGARHEVRRSMAALLRDTAPLVPATVSAVLADRPAQVPAEATGLALHRWYLAEAAFAQHRSEPVDTGGASGDWHAVLLTAHHVLIGAHWLPRFDRSALGADDILGRKAYKSVMDVPGEPDVAVFAIPAKFVAS
ncbi:FUSC family protein, partial [Streptomyces sp. NPDC006283]|uniref:FUSC family protein n=1 Tax=Streptomyces sp. NPDC006283 TaxID=3156741 RepID=UPI0033B494A9